MRFQIEVLAKWFDFISLGDLKTRQSHPKSKPFCLLTFDDGKNSHSAEVAPELLRLGVPAVFYVCTESLDDGESLWFDRYAALVRTLGRAPDGLEPAVVKRLPYAELSQRLRQAGAQYGIGSELSSNDARLMRWEDACALAQKGFSIGAHGLRHAILTNEPASVARLEIKESIRRVTAQIGLSCTTFAFPNGNYTEDLAQHAWACGTRTVMTTEPTWTDPNTPAWRLPRVQLFPGSTAARIECKLAAAAVRGILANPDGTGRKYAVEER